ncbi:MAG: SGNH hydrolase domain-containing protein [Acidimicrobiales bacterium]
MGASNGMDIGGREFQPSQPWYFPYQHDITGRTEHRKTSRLRSRKGGRGALKRSQPRVRFKVVAVSFLAVLVLAGSGTAWAVSTIKTAAPRPLVRVLLAGDSVAESMGWGLSVGAYKYDVSIVTVAIVGCGVTKARTVFYGGVVTPTEPYCQHWPVTHSRAVSRFHPNVSVLLAGRWEVANALWHGHWTSIDHPGYAAYIAHELSNAVKVLSSDGAKVALLTAPYYASRTEPFQPVGRPSCSPGCNRYFPEDSPQRVNRYNQILRLVAAQYPKAAAVIDLNAEVDPGGHFTSVIDGVNVRDADGIHFTVPQGGEWLRPWLLPRLAALAAA